MSRCSRAAAVHRGQHSSHPLGLAEPCLLLPHTDCTLTAKQAGAAWPVLL